MQIKSARLRDVQSYNDLTLNFRENTVNVLIGENSSGKSVMGKMFRRCCAFKHFTRKKIESTIRRGGPTYARMDIQFFGEPDTLIMKLFPTYVLWEWHGHAYKSKEGIPKEFASELGILVDYELGRVFNILGDRQGLPMVESSTKYNGRTLNTMTKHALVEEMLERSEEELENLEGAKREVSTALKGVTYSLGSRRMLDVEGISDSVQKIGKFQKSFSEIMKISKGMGDIRTRLKERSVTPIALEKHIELADTVSVIKERECEDIFIGGLERLSRIKNIKIKKYKDAGRLRRAEELVDSSLIKLRIIKDRRLDKLHQLSEMEIIEERSYKPDRNIKAFSLVLDFIEECGKYSMNQKELETAKGEIARYVEEVGICPTCEKKISSVEELIQ